jgi:hypothetical protein
MLRFLACLLSTALLAVPAQAVQDAKSKQKEFDDLIARVKKSDASIDFGDLRMRLAELDAYSPYGDGGRKEAFAKLDAGDYKGALEIANKTLEKNYLDVDAHLAAAVAADKLGEAVRSAHHIYVAKGIITAIGDSGDGKSASTAYKVITVSEEYMFLRVMGLQVKGQGLQHVDGHSFDVMKVVDPQTKAESSVYFNIDPIFKAQTKKFGGK